MKNESKRPIVVGVAGGTGSGKTTIVTEILKDFGTQDVLLIQHDSYYRDRSHLSSEERANVNYDHPDAR
jgi:uridine kinase